MKILVNGQSLDVEAGTLAEALGALGYGPQGIATALNGTFVAAHERAGIALQPGDQVEVVAPMQGG